MDPSRNNMPLDFNKNKGKPPVVFTNAENEEGGRWGACDDVWIMYIIKHIIIKPETVFVLLSRGTAILVVVLFCCHLL